MNAELVLRDLAPKLNWVLNEKGEHLSDIITKAADTVRDERANYSRMVAACNDLIASMPARMTFRNRKESDAYQRIHAALCAIDR